jgi:signal transduction histidine kinase
MLATLRFGSSGGRDSGRERYLVAAGLGLAAAALSLAPIGLVLPVLVVRQRTGILLNGVHDFSKIEAGTLQLENAECAPLAVVDDAVQLLAEKVKQRRNRLYVDVAGNIPSRVRGDAVRLRQILLTLMDHAAKFTEHGTIRVHSARPFRGTSWS